MAIIQKTSSEESIIGENFKKNMEKTPFWVPLPFPVIVSQFGFPPPA